MAYQGQDFSKTLGRFYLGPQFQWLPFQGTLSLWQLLVGLAFVFTVRSSQRLSFQTSLYSVQQLIELCFNGQKQGPSKVIFSV